MSVSDYQKQHRTYAALAAKAAEGDVQAKKDKAKVFQDCRAMERELNRNGYHVAGGQVLSSGGRSKRSMQEEYVGKFAKHGDVPVRITDAAHPEGRTMTLHEYHRARLLGK